MRCFYWALCCVLAGVVTHAQAEDKEPAHTFDPAQLKIKAGEGLFMPDPGAAEPEAEPPPFQLPPEIDPELLGIEVIKPAPEQGEDPPAPTRLVGGVTVFYEKIRLQGDHLDLWQSALVPEGRLWPERVKLQPGPDGPEPERVHIDTRYSELPTMNFNGLLRPKQVLIDRREWSGTGPITYHIILQDLGKFRGEVPRKNGEWMTITGWGRHLLIELVTDMQNGKLVDPRLRAIHLIGSSIDGEVPRDARAYMEIWDEKRPVRFLSKRISVHFSNEGQVSHYSSGKDSEMEGIPAGTAIPDLPEYHILADPQLEKRKAARKQQQRDQQQAARAEAQRLQNLASGLNEADANGG